MAELQSNYACLVNIMTNNPSLQGPWEKLLDSMGPPENRYIDRFVEGRQKDMSLPVTQFNDNQMGLYLEIYTALGVGAKGLADKVIGDPTADDTTKQLKDLLSMLQEGNVSTTDQTIQEVDEDYLSQLRLRLKYMVFDLEATRRENRYLRKMLETRRRRKRDDDDSFDQ